MPHCTKCGTSVADASAFCPNCGAPQTVTGTAGGGAAAAPVAPLGGLHLITIVLGMFFGFSLFAHGWPSFSFGFLLLRCVNLLGLILWILCMVKAYQGQRFRVPIAADLAESIFGKS
jgi:hypothetical protein